MTLADKNQGARSNNLTMINLLAAIRISLVVKINNQNF